MPLKTDRDESPGFRLCLFNFFTLHFSPFTLPQSM